MTFLTLVFSLSLFPPGHAQVQLFPSPLRQEKPLRPQPFAIGEVIACDRDRTVVRINFAPGHSEWRSITRAGNSSTTFDFYDEGGANQFHLTLRLADFTAAASSEGNALRWLVDDWVTLNGICHDLGARPHLPKSDGLVTFYQLHFRWH